jgi:UDP-glucose 4-epimerase
MPHTLPDAATIAITGVAGFIGSNLADYLLAEARRQGTRLRLIGIDNLAYGVREQIPPEVDFRQLDIRSRELAAALHGVDYLYHLAAKNCISDCQQDPVETADINVTGTVNVFEACRRAGVRKVIYAESSALYEGSTVLPTPESEVAPRSMYAISKLAGMHFAEAYARFHGLRTTALRYFCVYGPRQDYRRTIPPVMSAFIIKLLRGQRPIIYGTGDKRRDFIHVADINRFHLQCLTDPRTDGHVYNLGSGQSHSVREIYELLGELLDTRLEPERRPDLPGEAFENRADIAAARALGWAPTWELRRGLADMIAYIRAEIAAGRLAP